MKKSDLEHIQRSRYLESGQKIKSEIDNIVRSINHKYPELAESIEISPDGSIQEAAQSSHIMRYIRIFMNNNILA